MTTAHPRRAFVAQAAVAAATLLNPPQAHALLDWLAQRAAENRRKVYEAVADKALIDRFYLLQDEGRSQDVPPELRSAGYRLVDLGESSLMLRTVAISNIGRIHMGIEFGAEAKIYKGLSINAAAAIGKYYYNTRQEATVTIDNSAAVASKETVYSKNFYVPTPQQAFTIGLDYRSPQFWFITANFNYFDKMYLSMNPIRRTANAVDGVTEGSELWHQIIDQTKLKSQYTVDVFGGYSWLMNRKFHNLKKRTFLVFNVGVNNILNNQKIVSGGFEQLRFDFAGKNVNKFPERRFYAYGINYFASVGIRF